MPGVRHDPVLGLGPGAMQLVRGHDWADHVIAPLHDRSRDGAEPVRVLEQGVFGEKYVVYEVVRFDPRKAQGNDIPGGERQITPAKRGQDVVLSIDASLQWNTEQSLLQGVTDMNAQSGTAVIVDVQTGDVLAMATVNGPTPTQPARVAAP